jgi:hypothetical protein
MLVGMVVAPRLGRVGLIERPQLAQWKSRRLEGHGAYLIVSGEALQ